MIRFILKLWRKFFGSEDKTVHYEKVARTEGFKTYLSKTKSKKTGDDLVSKTQRWYLEALYLEGFTSNTPVNEVFETYKSLKNRPNEWHSVHLSAGLYHLHIYHTGKKPIR